MNGKRDIVVITGVSGHVGSELAARYLRTGAKVIGIDKVSSLELPLPVRELGCEYAGGYTYHSIDLGSRSELESLEAIFEKNSPNILVNNAAFVADSATSGWTSSFEKQSLDLWDRSMAVNLTAPFFLSQLFSKHQVVNEQQRGAIVNIGSIYGHIGPDWSIYEGSEGMGNPCAYSVSKAGLAQLTRWTATTLAPAIRVNAVAPGGLLRNQPEEFVDRYSAKVPLDRMGAVEDVVEAVLFLGSSKADYITGQTLFVDGGLSIW